MAGIVRWVFGVPASRVVFAALLAFLSGVPVRAQQGVPSGRRRGSLSTTHQESNLALKNKILQPVRLAVDPRDWVYVSDPAVGSVFILDDQLRLRKELRGLSTPLGVGVDASGRIYVGNQGRGNVEVYSPQGFLSHTLGAATGEFSRPTDLAVAPDGTVFVADSDRDVVVAYTAQGQKRFTIGGTGSQSGQFDFPVAVALSPDASEVFVADQNNYRVQIFDRGGTYLRSFGGYVSVGNFQGKFARLQSLAVVAGVSGNEVHAVDTIQNWVQVLSDTGVWIETYGTTGTNPGELNLPLDIAVDSTGRVIACNTGNARVEVIR